MRLRARHGISAVALLVGSVLAGSVPSDAVIASAPYCGIVWGSLPKEAGGLSGAPVVATRTGQHPCYDRVVFELGDPGIGNGYRVRYAAEVPTEGEGRPLVIAGGAFLRVSLLHPAYDVDTGASTYTCCPTDVAGYRTLRDLVFGGTYEGYTTFRIGVRARLPFRVFVLSGPGTHSRIVIDIAHRW